MKISCDNMKRVAIFLVTVLISTLLQAQDIKAGPWVSGVRENSVTILWTSEKPGLAWVELENGTVKYDTFAGRRVFHRLHSIQLDGFRPGQVVRYRIGGQVLTDDSNARKPQFGDTYCSGWFSVRTFDPAATECRFSIFNDIHMRTREYR